MYVCRAPEAPAVLNSPIPYYTALHYTVLHYDVLHCTVLYRTAAYCTVLHSTVDNALHHTAVPLITLAGTTLNRIVSVYNMARGAWDLKDPEGNPSQEGLSNRIDSIDWTTVFCIA